LTITTTITAFTGPDATTPVGRDRDLGGTTSRDRSRLAGATTISKLVDLNRVTAAVFDSDSYITTTGLGAAGTSRSTGTGRLGRT
jgi:hypothetical protein